MEEKRGEKQNATGEILKSRRISIADRTVIKDRYSQYRNNNVKNIMSRKDQIERKSVVTLISRNEFAKIIYMYAIKIARRDSLRREKFLNLHLFRDFVPLILFIIIDYYLNLVIT